MDLIAILLLTPFSDRFHRHSALFFSIPTLFQILGLLLTSYAGSDENPWPRYGGLLIVGFGLGPTVPITMTWTAEIFQRRHGEVGVAAASAVVSVLMQVALHFTDRHDRDSEEQEDAFDGAARREVQQRGLRGLGSGMGQWLRRGKTDQR
ncbi:hypothetical protein N7520_009673 [Penicillium odoratum]|uniref:uncharacterized protein n=1 Tax=Penicillium odoratum TaxID=1167516 RepID=UPI002548D0ED|nr:uncharacterized protein N7520_009673 [Penicillium odoratum]KAJ5752756.1 hypothetical protein N7520_009673 [Penicillium odoratum]